MIGRYDDDGVGREHFDRAAHACEAIMYIPCHRGRRKVSSGNQKPRMGAGKGADDVHRLFPALEKSKHELVTSLSLLHLCPVAAAFARSGRSVASIPQ